MVVQLVNKFIVESAMSAEAALLKVLRLIDPDSSYTFVLVDKEQPDTLFVVKNKSPLLVGIADDYSMVGSGATLMVKETSTFMEINDHELVIVRPDHIIAKDFGGDEIDRLTFKVDMDANAVDRGAHPYYMLKEINE